MRDYLNSPYGGELVDSIATPERISELRAKSRTWPSWDLTVRQLCDLELLLNGGLSPLRGFMSRRDYESVCDQMRLVNGTVWPIPIVLDISDELARTIGPGSSIALRDPEGAMLAALRVEEMWQPDRHAEAETVYGTTSSHHTGVQYLLERTRPWNLSGRLEGTQIPRHHDFRALRFTPSELRADFIRLGWRQVVAFHPQNEMHRVHHEMSVQAIHKAGANLLIHPCAERANPDAVEYYGRVRCCQALLSKFTKGSVKLALLPLAMRMCGPREAMWHAIIRKNYGCSHFIVGDNYGVPGNCENAFYARYAAQELLGSHEKEIGITMVPFPKMVYLRDKNTFVTEDKVPDGSKVAEISEKDLRVFLSKGRDIPSWFTFPEIARELQRNHPPRHRRGFTVFFTGLSGSGKSTSANVLLTKLLEMGGRPVTILDGDIVRKHLSSELGFSREHRDINIRRIGYVASEITKNGGIAICAPIAPYDAVRKQVRAMIEAHGGFILVHLTTPLHVCESRDLKGLYAKARAGLVQQFTGISDPYESPNDAEIVVDTTELTPEQVAQKIFVHLQREGFIKVCASGVWSPPPDPVVETLIEENGHGHETRASRTPQEFVQP